MNSRKQLIVYYCYDCLTLCAVVQIVQTHDKARRTKPALGCVVVYHGLLNGVQVAVLADAVGRCDLQAMR